MKIKKLNESMLPSQATLDDCLDDYRQNAFGFAGVEDYVDTNYPMHPQEFKAAICDYLKNHKNESLQEAWQVGDQVTIKWNEPNFEPYAYATCEYQGKTEDGKHKFKSTTYGWDFIVDLENKKIKTPHDKEYDLWDESGWTKNATNEAKPKSIKEDLEDIEFIVDTYLPDLLVSDTDKPGKYEMSYRGNDSVSVIVEFDPSYSEYVFTIDGEGPHSYGSYEYIQGEIERALDKKLQKNESKSIKEAMEDIEDWEDTDNYDFEAEYNKALKEVANQLDNYGEEEAAEYLYMNNHIYYGYKDKIAKDLGIESEYRKWTTPESKSIKESLDTMIYLFPELTDEDLEMAKGYGLQYLGKNHGADGSEDNWVLRGAESSLRMFADKYLGYELHPDYLYDEEDFAGDIINESLMGLELDKDDILDWLAEHEQAWADAERHFNGEVVENDADSPLLKLSVKELVEWIADHKQLYDDFHRFFYEDNLDEEFLNFDFNQNPDDDIDGIIQ